MAKDPSKTEKATPKRLNKARNRGNVAKSQEVAKTITLLAGFLALYAYVSVIGREIMGLYRHFLDSSFDFDAEPNTVMHLMRWLAEEVAFMVLPVILFIGLVVVITLRLQVGKLWTTKVFKPKLSRFNPIPGLQRMFLSKDTLIRMLKNILQAFAIGLAPYLVIANEFPTFITLFHTNAWGLTAYLMEVGAKVVQYALAPMLVIAIADFFYTRWEYAENLKMTKDEVKDEMKQMEGDPRIKAKQRQKMMEMMRRRMMQEVPKADVIITNPTHFAVALKYDALAAPAPMVIAKGVDAVALKIKEIAAEHNIPIRENKPLARALYKSVEIGETIPEELYQAVASILASLPKFRNKAAQQQAAAQKN